MLNCRVMRGVWFSLLALLLLTHSSESQTTIGLQPLGSYSSGVDSVNLADLGIHVDIPLFSHSARGKGMGASVRLIYDSAYLDGGNTSYQYANVGWRITATTSDGGTIVVTQISNNNCSGFQHGINYGTYQYYQFVFVDSTGYSHPFSGHSTVNQCTNGGTGPASSDLNESASDGSGYILVTQGIGGTVTSPSGTKANGFGTSTTITDSNGNVGAGQSQVDKIDSVAGLQGATLTLTDTSNLSIKITGGGYTSTSGTFTGRNPVYIQYTDTTGNPQQIVITYRIYNVAHFMGPSTPATQYAAGLVDAVTYPDGSSYHFTYQPSLLVSGASSGALGSIELPTGGTISYSNTWSQACGYNPASTTRSTSDGATTYTFTQNSTYQNNVCQTATSTTAISNVDGSSESVQFVWTGYGTVFNILKLETAHSWKNSSGALLRSTLKCYNGTSSGCATASITQPISQIATSTTLDNGQTAKAVELLNSYRLPTEVDTYDFGGASPIEKAITTYASLGNNIHDRPQSIITYDGSGNVIAQRAFSYDEYTLSPSGVTGLATISGSRGNPTTISSAVSSSSNLSVHTHYDDAGQTTSTTDESAFVTTYAYDPTDAYLTSKTYPPVSGGTFTEYFTPDANTGLLVQSKDVNGNVTQYSYDVMLRPEETDYPDGGQTQWSYGQNPTTVTTIARQSASASSMSETELDGYSRMSRIVISNGQGTNAYYQKDTCYDAMGNTSFISYPYQGAGLGMSKVCVGAGDAFTYDALHRLTKMTRANGESRQVSYTGRATKSVDENNVTRISQSDGLGRMTSICEISSNSGMPGSGSAVSCGLDIAGTGFATNMSYDLANHKLTAVQGVQSRTVQTDWVGRILSSQQPEAGLATYSYSYDATGLVVTRQRPKENQTSPSVLTTTTTQHDALGRVVSVSYSDGTPTKAYTYDVSAGWADLAQTNLKGRLSISGVTGAQTVVSYDSMGRVSALDQCLPSTCGTSDKQIRYTYDFAGNLVTSSDGAGVTSTYAVSPAGEVTSITSSRNDSTHPPNLISGVQNGPFGPVHWQLGNGLTEVRSYDSLGRLSGGWLCSSSSVANCSGGTQLYAFTTNWRGTDLTSSCDTALNQCSSYGYDDFGRLSSKTVSSGNLGSFNYIYDRWGNRWQQNVTSGSGPQPQLSFNTTTNQINTAGFSYDAVGNLLSDGTNNYLFDAEGNQTQQSSSAGTNKYTYNALGQQVRADFLAFGSAAEVVFDRSGLLASAWSPGVGTAVLGKSYWNSTAIESYTSYANMAFYPHRDWLGTRRSITNASGTVTFLGQSLPFGDGASNVSGSQDNTYDGFTGLWAGGSNATNHAQYREYWNTGGRWLQPDPSGVNFSDLSNPQSLDLYSYVKNNPIGSTDPTGLCETCGADWYEQTFEEDNQMISSDIERENIGSAIAGQALWEAIDDAYQASYGGSAGPHETIFVGCSGPSIVIVRCYPIGPYRTLLAPDQSPYMTDDYRRYAVSREITSEAGWMGTWRGPVWWYGASLAGASGSIMSSLAELDSVTVVVGEGEPLHVAFGVDGEWLHATGNRFFNMVISSNRAGAWVRGMGVFRFSVPVLNPSAVLGTAGAAASSCVTGACYAIWRGWVQ